MKRPSRRGDGGSGGGGGGAAPAALWMLCVALWVPLGACAASDGQPPTAGAAETVDATEAEPQEDAMSAEEIYRAALAGQRRLAEAWRARADEEELARLAAALRGDLERLASRVGATEKEATAAPEAGAGSGRVEPSDPVTPSRQPPSEAEIEAMERATAELRTVLPPPETGAGTADEPSLAAVSRDRIGRACGEAIERLDRLEALWRRPQPDRRQIEAALAELERALDAVARPPGTDDAEPLPDG